MSLHRPSQRTWLEATIIAGVLALAGLGAADRTQAPAQTRAVKLSGSYAEMDARRQRLVDDWVARFNAVTGHTIQPGPFYDEIVNVSAKTTFEAVTHALMRTPLTDETSGAALGDGLDLLAQVDTVEGQVEGVSGDRQFRMYARLTEGTLDRLERSKEFSRGADNTVYHKGYPISYRQQGGVPSIQISISTDGRRGDIDVDYRSASFPKSMFNGHLTSSNSDVRAGNNYDRHDARWTGLQNWWRSFFGIRVTTAAEPWLDKSRSVPRTPRLGKKDVELMMRDFLQAWLVEGDVMAAMGYVSGRAYACLAKEGDDPSALDRGMAPFDMLRDLKAAHEAIGTHASLDGLIAPVRLPGPELRPVRHPYEAQFALYSVPDDLALRFDCESRLTPGDPRSVRRAYGDYVGGVFRFDTARGLGSRLSLLWTRQDGYWKIVSWQSQPDSAGQPAALHLAPEEPEVPRMPADPTLVDATRAFLESWLIRKNYDAAFRHVSPRSYACYDIFRGPDQPPSTSPDDAGRKIRAGMERAASGLGRVRSLDAAVTAADPTNPVVRLLEHPQDATFTLVGYPDALGEWADCAARSKGARPPGDAPAQYGRAFGMNIRFLTRDGEGPVLRTLWVKESDAWRITAYDVEVP